MLMWELAFIRFGEGLFSTAQWLTRYSSRTNFHLPGGLRLDHMSKMTSANILMPSMQRLDPPGTDADADLDRAVTVVGDRSKPLFDRLFQ